MKILRRAFPVLALVASPLAHASFLSGDALDTAADWASWFVIAFVPLVAIGAFLFVHVLPEKIAEKRQHPHKDSIKVLCILSLFFGGLLWPLAWLWAYTKPIGYRAIYGSDKHDDYYIEEGEKALQGQLAPDEVQHLRIELAAMAAKGSQSPELRRLTEQLDEMAAASMPPAQPVRPVRVVETVGGTK